MNCSWVVLHFSIQKSWNPSMVSFLSIAVFVCVVVLIDSGFPSCQSS